MPNNLVKLSLVYTSLQKKILMAISGDQYANFLVFYPLDRIDLGGGNETAICTSDNRLSIKRARCLIGEIRHLIESKIKNRTFEVWLASCDSPIGQVLINHPNCRRVVLFEDGIGSYVTHSFLDVSLGWRSFLRKMKYIIYLFPHYRAIYGIGSHKADEYWAIHESAFPRATIESNLVNAAALKKLFLLDKIEIDVQKNDVIFLEQALTRHIAKKDYEDLICGYLTVLERAKSPARYFIKPHPTSTDQEIRETVDLFYKSTSKEILLIEKTLPVESVVLGLSVNPIEVFSVASSALYTLNILNPDLKVVSISSEKLLQNKPYFSDYIQALCRLGVENVHLR